MANDGAQGLQTVPAGPDAQWSVSNIESRRATGDVLVTRGGWSVSFDTSSETGKVATLTCRRYASASSFEIAERDVMDGQTFPTVNDAECYALNAGRLQWYRDWKAGRATSAPMEAR